MNHITKPVCRVIIDDFAKTIKERREKSDPPDTWVIDFRDELRRSKGRPVFLVPIDCLRYRKDNGRISSDVLHYEKNYGILKEESKKAQEVIKKFLKDKDKDKTNELRDSILLKGQQEPAIITCDGFLINGNRRKLVMEMLKGDPKFQYMKVVILPGKDDDDEGGPPTLKEIEQIENRYQLQSWGKAEYYGFDRALSIRRKIELGMALEEQLRDDPSYANLPDKKFNKAVIKFEEEYLRPLKCVDRYLSHLGRVGLYGTIAKGITDPEGRWQAFIDYYKSVYKKLANDNERMKLGINEDEIGKIEDIAFKIIRKRELKSLPKAHEIIRDFPKMLANKDSKKELFRLLKLDLELSREECVDENGNEYSERDKDRIWGKRNEEEIIWRIKKAINYHEGIREAEEPLTLLDVAFKKLNHDNMQVERIRISDLPKARSLAVKIKERAVELEHEFYHYEKKSKKDIKHLTKKY